MGAPTTEAACKSKLARINAEGFDNIVGTEYVYRILQDEEE